MTRAPFAALFTLMAFSWAGPASAQAPTQPPATPRNATPAPHGPDANPANQGRLQLDQYLDSIATEDQANRATAVAAIDTRAQALARQAKVRAQILSLIGSLPPRTPLNAKFVGETQADGFVIRKVIFESQPNFFVTALLYVPDGPIADGKRAAIIMSPGHAPSGKAAMRLSPQSSPVTASLFSPTIRSAKASGCNIPTRPSPTLHSSCALLASTARPACNPC